jgi:hypothetical protein
MHQRTVRAFVGAFATILVAACGGDDNGPSGPSAETTFPAMMVETFGETGALLADYAVSAIDFNGTNVGFAPGVSRVSADPGQLLARFTTLVRRNGEGPQLGPWAVSSPSCAPTITGAGTDTDADGVPDDMLVEYTAANCTVTDTATGDVTVTRGTLRYRDTNNSLYGFDVTVTALRQDTYDGSSHYWNRQVISVHETAKTTTTGGTWALVIDSDLASGTADTTQYSAQAKYDVTGKYTSNGAVPAGGPMPDGTLTVGGTLDATLPTSGRLVMDIVTTNPIHYESSCSGNDAGEMELRLNGSTSEGVHVKWTGCSGAAYEFIGSGVL